MTHLMEKGRPQPGPQKSARVHPEQNVQYPAEQKRIPEGQRPQPDAVMEGAGGEEQLQGFFFLSHSILVHSSFVHSPISSILSSSFQKFMQAGMQIALPVI